VEVQIPSRCTIKKKMKVAKHYKPRWTMWNRKTVRYFVIAHKRRCRRAYRQYLRTGSLRDYNRSQKMITQWDFD